MEFIGRADERARLVRELASERQSVVLVYGRRRIGKSELIKRAISDLAEREDASPIYYECKQTGEANNVESLTRLICDLQGRSHLAFRDMEDLLAKLFGEAREHKTVLVLDEYPYLRSAVRGLDSIIQSLVDANREGSRMKLILCGSCVDVMQSLIEPQSPLFGRVDLTMALRAMDYHDSAQFYPEFSDEDKVRLFSVFGGVPYYNRLIDPSLTVRENIIELVASPGARLENEVGLYLHSEISKIENANAVFEALAQGHTKYKDILDHSHASSSPAMADVLAKLMSMELVEKRMPINTTNPRRANYRITDGMSQFHFRYITRFSSQMQVMDPEVFYGRYIEESFESSFVPRSFEVVCRQFLVRQNKAGLIEEPFERVGSYYYDDPVNHTNGEFDVVTEDPLGYAFYEAKFRKAPLTEQMVADEVAQVEATGLSCHLYGFFSRSGFATTPGPNMAFYDLSDLFA